MPRRRKHEPTHYEVWKTLERLAEKIREERNGNRNHS